MPGKHGPTVGEYLRSVRLDKGWTLREAAKRVGVAHSRVVEVENMLDARLNRPFTPSLQLLRKFAKGYGLVLSDLLRRAGYDIAEELDEDERRLLEVWRALPVEKHASFWACIETLTSGTADHEMPR